MNVKFVLVFLFFLLTLNAASAATFVVTNNADAGPGTLREALNNAANNGTTTQDIIQFNLPGNLPSDRTIRLKSQLPAVTSNVVIDGTTQPGIPFGVSDAKVILEPETSPASFNGLLIYSDYTSNTTKGVEIYGLYIRNFAQINSLSNFNSTQGSGIAFAGGGSGITIGAPGKGNVICGNVNAIYSNYAYYQLVSDITIQSNIIGLTDDGTTLNSNINGISIQADKSVTIGGTDPKQGNVIAGNLVNVSIGNTYYFTSNKLTIAIQNNKIGTDYTGTIDYKQNQLFSNSPFIIAYGIDITSGNSTTTIANNIVSGQRGYGIAINYSYNYNYSNTTQLSGNFIGTDATGTKDLGNTEGVMVNQNSSCYIGGANASDVNIIAYNQTGVEAKAGSNTLITRNSFYCNTDVGIVVPSTYPFVQLLKYSGSAASGLATPNTKIELFYTDDCPHANGNCQGKDYITTVTADVSGRWSYSGTLTKTVVATATDGNKNTSAFSTLTPLATEPVIKHYTCAYEGSITISEPREGIQFHWDKKEDNGTLTAISDEQSISNLLPGIYILTIQYPGGCLKTIKTFEIKDNRIKIQQIIPPVPQCRQKQFQVSTYYSGGTGTVQFQWIDANGNVVGTGNPATVPGGTLRLKIIDDLGQNCSVTSDPFTITPKVGPDFDYSAEQVQSAQCGKSDGSIKGIKAFDITGTATYQWYTYTYANGVQNSVAVQGATSTDLTGVPGGTYYLVITDQSECSPWQSQNIFVNTTNSVFINGGYITPATCGFNNGAIYGISVINGNKYEWTGPNGPISNNNQVNLNNLTDGTYTLKVTNTITGCNNSASFYVNRVAPDVFNPSPTYTSATCSMDNGGVQLTFAYATPQPRTITWFDANNQPVASTSARQTNGDFTSTITNVTDGNYYIRVTDHNSCIIPQPLGPYKVDRIPILAFASDSKPIPTNDQCDLQTGSITGLKITGGQGPFTYTWTDANGKVVGNDINLVNIGKGDYTLVVTDNIHCQPPVTTGPVTVGNDEVPQTPPVLKNVRICNPQTVTFGVINAQPGLYKLYQHIDDAEPLTSSLTNILTYPVNETGDYYVSYSHGTCESPRTKVHVEVILVDIKMGNTFTPNGDGINDIWRIQGLEKFPGALVQVFTRSGQLIFQSTQPTVFFDGNWRGKPLPIGTYYYVINLNTPCKILAGSLALIR